MQKLRNQCKLLIFHIINSDLDEHIVDFGDGSVALQSILGNVVKRLQIIGINNDVVYVRSDDGGVTITEQTRLLKASDITFVNVLNVDIFYDPDNDMCFIKYRIHDNLHYQLGFGRSAIIFDAWDGKEWTRVWTK